MEEKIKGLLNKRRYLKGRITSIERALALQEEPPIGVLRSYSSRLADIFQKVEDINLELQIIDEENQHLEEGLNIEKKFLEADAQVRSLIVEHSGSKSGTEGELLEYLEHRCSALELIDRTEQPARHILTVVNQTEDQKEAEEPAYFLPHHAVIKERSTTTRLRVVFNCSAPTSTQRTLNQTMLAGSVLQPDLFSILIRFRMPRYVFIADIEKMFRQILVYPEDRKLQKILWRDSPEEKLKCLELNTVTYGTTSASFLATRTLLQLVQDEGAEFPLASDALKCCTYMDDIMTGSDNLNTAITLKNELIELLMKGGFSLHKWFSNNSELLRNISSKNIGKYNYMLSDGSPTLKALGVMWNPVSDTFLISVSENFTTCAITKREVLSNISKMFDPLGLIGCVNTFAKLILQSIWKLKLQWDDKLPPDILQIWEKFSQNLNSLNNIEIPRRFDCKNVVKLQLHGFCDSSTVAYGCCIYIRASDELSHRSVQLLCSKSRVAPLKPVTLARLELCAALLLTRVIKKVKEILQPNINSVFYWTDATITLAWIKGDPTRWNVFDDGLMENFRTLDSSRTPRCWNGRRKNCAVIKIWKHYFSIAE